MYLLGSFVTQQYTDKAVLDDVDFFPFPEMAMEGQDAVEAPIDGLLLRKRAAEPGSEGHARLPGTPEGQEAYFSVDSSNMSPPRGRTPPVQRTQQEMRRHHRRREAISQFFDRDALPAMANNVMIPALQSFLKDGSIRRNLEAQAKALYAAQ